MVLPPFAFLYFLSQWREFFSLCPYHITENADVKQKIWIPKNFFGKAVDF